jgi:hypothetical protein
MAVLQQRGARGLTPPGALIFDGWMQCSAEQGDVAARQLGHSQRCLNMPHRMGETPLPV